MSVKDLRGLQLMKALCLEFGPSGCEGRVAKLILENIEGTYDELIPDNMGAVIALVRGSGESSERLMMSCHMDEVGFMVRHIEDNGLIRFSSMMGGDTRIMAGRRVTVGMGDRLVRGVISMKPLHLVTERDASADMDELYIDIGAKDKEEAEKHVHIGDFGTFESDFVRFGENDKFIKAKAIDDRLGCAVMCDMLHALRESGKKLPFDVYFAFTCKEELGLSGARCAAHKIRPTKALVLESTAVGNMHGTPKAKRVAERGEGGVVSIMDRGTIYDRKLTDHILDTAKKHGIPCQIKKFISGGNDAMHIHKEAAGCACAVISAPSCYIHTASNVIAACDYENIYNLALMAVSELEA